MRHATIEALHAVEPLLASLRALNGLLERSPGIYYRKSKAFLHFHEDGAALFADLKINGAWVRFPATSAREQKTLLEAARRQLT